MLPFALLRPVFYSRNDEYFRKPPNTGIQSRNIQHERNKLYLVSCKPIDFLHELWIDTYPLIAVIGTENNKKWYGWHKHANSVWGIERYIIVFNRKRGSIPPEQQHRNNPRYESFVNSRSVKTKQKAYSIRSFVVLYHRECLLLCCVLTHLLITISTL